MVDAFDASYNAAVNLLVNVGHAIPFSMTKNPLLEPSPLPFSAVPFDNIQLEHYLPALKQAIADSKVRVEKIKTSKESPTFENTVEALETCSENVDSVASVFFNLLSAEADEKHQQLAQEFSPILADFSSDLSLDPDLFKRVKAVYDQRQNLQGEALRLVEKMYTDFVRNGALLDEKQKARVREIDQELSKLGPQFADNVLKATNQFELVVTDKQQLKGLPDSAIEAAALSAQDRGKKEAWIISLQAPSYVPFMTYAENRALREKLWRAYNSRCLGGEADNQEMIRKIVSLRYERAQLMGFKNHADFVLQERMAENSKRVFKFLNELLDASLEPARKDIEEVSKLAKQADGLEKIQPWDFAYYSEKLRQQKFDLDQEQLRPYFELERTINGVFEHARRLYDLEFIETNKLPVYHPDVKVYEVRSQKDQSFVGLFYADFFPRPTKKGGAWMTTFRDQGLFFGKVNRPHVSIVCNLTKPTPSRPSLLTFEEVQTLFHEFGHSLHALLSNCRYRSLSGTNVYWDFVELPSQIMENWILEKESLDLFASHYQTGEKLPKELAAKIKTSARFQSGYTSLRQVNFALLDMAWHTQNPDSRTDVAEFENKVTAKSTLLPKIPGTNISCGFSHIFAGGYSAGYYSYKWAEVLDADAFELFLQQGIFNSEIAQRFRENILARGGTEHPMVLYKKFRGREPDPKALLRRDGLI